MKTISAMKKRGTREEVFLGLAQKTAGNLDKSMLIKNKRGKIVSKRRSEQSAANAERLKQWQFKKSEKPSKKRKLDE